MKYAKFSDDFLSDFRLDDVGETLVLTDKRGYTRAVKLLPYEERPHGKWVFGGFCVTSTQYICNQCTIPNLEKTNFCPNCGADMRQEAGNEET